WVRVRNNKNIYTTGIIRSDGDIRAPIFYDSNDTNYYVDPASTSILNVARINSIQSPNTTSVVAADNAMPNSGHSFIYTLAQGPGGNDGHIFGMTWSGTTSIYGAQLWLDTDPTNKMSLRSRNNVGVWNSWADVITSWSDDQVKTGYFQSNSSLRAPIFYDSNDTSYYLDPNSQSFLYYTSVNVGQESTGAANSSNAGLVLRGNYNSNTWAHKFHKYDNGNGVPLYLSYTWGAGSWSGLQGWGAGLSYTSQVFGSFSADSLYSTIYYDRFINYWRQLSKS
ncbi:MAG: hypothetical protein EBX41_10345, partial [Chitinophagia bacterium]|nr:hypothetical protein [Chitinophagia bacterium]